MSEPSTQPITESVAAETKEASANAAIDLLGNGKVLKTVLVEGAGDYPQVGANVKVHYTGTLTDGSKFDSSVDRNVPFEFVLGAGRVIKGWDVCVASMKKGEKCRVELHPDFAYGEAGSPPTIPPNATLVFEIELLNYNSRKEKWAMSCDEKLTAAAELKQEGTSYLKESKLSMAAQAYSEAASMIDKLDDWPESQQEEAKALLVSSNLNLALVQLKLENWLETIIACGAVVQVDPQNVKALFRRAQARVHLDEYDAAIQDLNQSLEIEPDNAEIKRQLAITKHQKKENENKVKSFYKRMF